MDPIKIKRVGMDLVLRTDETNEFVERLVM